MAGPFLSVIPPRIETALKRASKATGTDFDYLLKTAQRESAFKPGAKAKTSTAAGLFQFIEQTWLSTLKDAGPRHGLGQVADAITRTPSGKYVVSDPATRNAIFALRFDPKLSALMAGEFTRKNARVLEAHIGRKPSDGELYIGHFLGASKASKLINLARTDPNSPAAPNFARAAKSNRAIFYTASGQGRSHLQVYQNLTRHYDTRIRTENTKNPEKELTTTANTRARRGNKTLKSGPVRPLTQALFTVWQTPLDKMGDGSDSSLSAFHNLFLPGKANTASDSARSYREAGGRYLPTEAQLLAAFGKTDVLGTPHQKTATISGKTPPADEHRRSSHARISELFGRKTGARGGILKGRNPGGI
jgi:hypothetical protein